MKIKKFICVNCGAPKINKYETPYILCDYCGSLTDIDYTNGLEFWTANPEKTMKYSIRKFEFESKLAGFLNSRNIAKYKQTQYEYWDYYYDCYPEYLPPTIDTKEKYSMYLEVAAESSTGYAFGGDNSSQNAELTRFQSALKYYQKNGRSYVTAETFFPMADYYVNFLKESMKGFYSNPEYAIMNDLLPQEVHLKMKLSMFVQIWLPYLTEEDSVKFLKQTGFFSQYVEMDLPEGKNTNCGNCGNELYIPEGSVKIFCEKCRKFTKVLQTFNCMSCGAENSVPDNPKKTIDCEYCGTENRVVRPLFG